MRNYKTGKEWKKFDVQKFPQNQVEFYENYVPLNNKFIIDKKTPISSIGSCFAANVAYFLNKNNFNYIVKQDDMSQDRLSSADWGAVYNVPCLKQIYQYSFESFNPKQRWWDIDRQWVIEPFRRDISYKNSEKEKRFKTHAINSYNVLSDSEVTILTLGIAEVWRDKRDKSTYWRVVPKHLYDPKIHEFHIMTVDEVVDDLNEIKRIIDKHNPKNKLIISISPVPFFATFRTDIDPVSANMNSKSILRSAADVFVRNTENTYYFPAYEYIMAHDSPYKDGRHVKPNLINKAMRLFTKWYVKE